MVTISPDGLWAASFSVEASWNRTVAVTGSSGRTTVLDEVNFGDVLLCAGQSNMELPAKGPLSPEQATKIKILRLDHYSSPNRTIDTTSWGHSWDGTGRCTDRCGNPWTVLGAEPTFSAVCKFTGAALFAAFDGKVPIGLVESAWGGTRIESWSSQDALAQCPADTTAGCGPGLGPNPGYRMNSSAPTFSVVSLVKCARLSFGVLVSVRC